MYYKYIGPDANMRGTYAEGVVKDGKLFVMYDWAASCTEVPASEWRRAWIRTLFDRLETAYYLTIPHEYRPDTLWYNFTCWAWHRYSTVKSRHLDHTWCDAVDLLPYTMFEILTRFIDNECSPGFVDWEGIGHMVEVDGRKKNVREEMQDLYNWWNITFLKEWPDRDNKLSAALETLRLKGHTPWSPEYKSHAAMLVALEIQQERTQFEEFKYNKRIEMMHRLVNVAHYMWT